MDKCFISSEVETPNISIGGQVTSIEQAKIWEVELMRKPIESD